MNFDVIVVGSGLIGASLALALKNTGLKTAVIEAQPPRPSNTEWDSRVYAISPGSAAFLESCGIWQTLAAERMCRVEEMRIFGDDTHSTLDFGAYESGLRELAFIVENRSLQQRLWEALQREASVTLIAPARCKALHILDNEVELHLEDGQVLHARLVVGADGADSWVRAQAGIEVKTRDYLQKGVVANFTTGKPHHGIAYQWFLRDGVLAFLPLPGDRVSMVWSTTIEHAEQLMQLSQEELAAHVTAASRDVVGNLQLITAPAAFPLRLQRVRRLIAPRLALIGDAAHNVHPLAGQGVNLGFRDARELAQVLAQRGLETDCGSQQLLRRFERARSEDIFTMQLTTDALQRLFNNERTGLAGLRNFGLRLTNSQAHLKNLLVRHAVG